MRIFLSTSIWLVLGIFIFFSRMSNAQVGFPRNMNSADRQTLLQILGFGTASKIVGDPYPLGGYSGWTVGLSQDVLSTGEISQLGLSNVNRQTDMSLVSIFLGKGLYNDFDLFLNFIPPGQIEEISGFGGQIRWGVFQADYLPLHGALVAHSNAVNFQNLVSTSTQGIDSVWGFHLDDVTFFFGGGYIRTQGLFLGGTARLTDVLDPSGQVGVDGQVLTETLKENIGGFRTLAGINFKLGSSFLNLQLERVYQTTLTAQLGVRY